MVAYTFYETDSRVRRYAEALVKRGDQVDAIVLRREGQGSFDIIRGVRVHRIQKRLIDETGPLSYLTKLLMFFLRSMWLLILRTLRRRYDIIHVHSVPDFQVFSTLIPRLLGSRVILDIHDIVPEFYASKFGVSERSLTFRLLLFIEKLSIAYSDHVIISNHLWRDKLIRRSVRSEKCTVIINYPDTSIFFRRPRTAAVNRNFVLCYPGTLNRHQGVDLAIAAVALLREKVPNIKLLVIGDGPDRGKLKTAVKEQNLEDYVSISGFVPIEQVAESMANVDLGVVPKRKDSFGNQAFSTKIMEFMAMGVPVLASKTCIDNYYFSDRLVQFFEPGNVCDLAAKIMQMIQDPDRCDGLRANAAKFIELNNWDVRRQEYLDLVDNLVHHAHPAPSITSRHNTTEM